MLGDSIYLQVQGPELTGSLGDFTMVSQGIQKSEDIITPVDNLKTDRTHSLSVYNCICPISEGIGGCGNLNLCSIHEGHYWVDEESIVPILGVRPILICCAFLFNIFNILYLPSSQHILLLKVYFLSATNTITPRHALIWLSVLSGSNRNSSPSSVACSCSTNLISPFWML